MITPYYYTYDFVSPEGIWAEIKEEMKSYFRTGVIDDTMFPIYTDKSLKKLSNHSLKVDWTILELENGQAELPCDFESVREVYACTDIYKSVPLPSSYYYQKTCVVSPYGDYDPCNPCDTCETSCNREFKVVFKDTKEQVLSFNIGGWLKPGNTNARKHCHSHSPMLSNQFGDCGTFDIVGNTIVTDLECGSLYLIYYKKEIDENDFQMIPDNYEIQEYIKSFIKWKMYEQLWNEITDETSNQIERKYTNYKREADEALVMAQIETKKRTTEQIVNSIKRTKTRLNKYKRGLENRDYGLHGRYRY